MPLIPSNLEIFFKFPLNFSQISLKNLKNIYLQHCLQSKIEELHWVLRQTLLLHVEENKGDFTWIKKSLQNERGIGMKKIFLNFTFVVKSNELVNAEKIYYQ